MQAAAEFLKNNWALVAVFIAIAAAFLLARLFMRDGVPPYEKRGALLSEQELRFYRALLAAVGGSWTIFCMVRLSEVIAVPSDTPSAEWWREKLLDRRLDFVICDNDSLQVLLAIELDDPGPHSEKQRSRQRFFDSAFSAAGLTLLRIVAAEKYDRIELRLLLDQTLGLKKR